METLLWTRGRAFPLSRLESRLRCPRCGSRYVVILYEPPRRAAARQQKQALEVNRRVPIQRDQPRCEPCHTQSETDLDDPVIFPCRWLAKNHHGKSMSRLQSESS